MPQEIDYAGWDDMSALQKATFCLEQSGAFTIARELQAHCEALQIKIDALTEELRIARTEEKK